MLLTLAAAVAFATGADAQSLFVAGGERASEASIGWSVGEFSQGVEVQGGASLRGRWDVAFGVNHYDADLGGRNDSTLTEWSPSARYFLFKEQDDQTPVSVAVHGQYVHDSYSGSGAGWYALLGGELFKKLALTDRFGLYPYLAFSLAADSVSFAGGEPDRSLYLTRQFGVHTQFGLGERAWLRFTVEEHSFRRETYRAARVAYGRKF